MARILITWELGGGLGHLLPIRQLCDHLSNHEIYFAARDLQFTQKIFAGSEVKILVAPSIQHSLNNLISDPQCFSHLLFNCGFGEADTLHSLVNSWQEYYNLIQPDLVVFDHSPVALLASRGQSFKKVNMGIGFFCPPIQQPLAPFFTDNISVDEQSEFIEIESKVLAIANTVLAHSGIEPLTALSDLYRDIDKTLLMTLPEFDHFPHGRNDEYLGVRSTPKGKKPQWPALPGKRIYAYLRPFDYLESILKSIRASNQPTIVYSNAINQDLIKEYQSDNIHFESELLDLQLVAEQSDFAITYASHDTCVQLLLAGCPVLMIPLQKEQHILTTQAVKTGACLGALPFQKEQILTAMNQLANDTSYKSVAMALSEKYAANNDRSAQKKAADIITALLN